MGYSQDKFFGSDAYTSGTRYIISFEKEIATDQTSSFPSLYIESNDYALHAPMDAWGLSGNRVDLRKTDSELANELSFPWTSSMHVERQNVSGVDGVFVEEQGVDPLDQSPYHVIYYLFPKYNRNQSFNLSIRADFSEKQKVDRFLRDVKFEE